MTHENVITNEKDMKNLDPVFDEFYKRIMYVSIFILIIGVAISTFLLILKMQMVVIAFYCFVFGIFIGLISADTLLRKLMEARI
jgi:hypothetical protein